MLVVLSSSVFDEKPRFQVALLEVTNGTLTYLKQFDRMPENVGLSHDGRYLAFTQNDDLYVANLLTGEARQIAGSSDVRLSLQWMPNDDALLFVTGRFASELRLIRLTDGLPVGMIEALRTYDGPFWLLGISATGDLYYSASGKGSTLSIASFDVAMQQLGAPAAVAGVQSGRGMDWSPDSESIAYASYNQTKTLVTIRNLRTLVEREIELPQGVVCLRWSHQTGILTTSADNFSYLVNLDDMSVKLITAPITVPWSFEWAPWLDCVRR